MWLTRFEIDICENALEQVKSEDDGIILANVMMKLTDNSGDRTSLLRTMESVLQSLIKFEVGKSKKRSFENISDSLDIFLDHGEGIEKLAPKDRTGFQSLLKDPGWKQFTSKGSDKFRRDVLICLSDRLRSFFPSSQAPTSMKERQSMNRKGPEESVKIMNAKNRI